MNSTQPDGAEQASGQDAKSSAATSTGPEDDLVVTHHTLATHDSTLHYTAQTGRIVLREEVLTEEALSGHIPKAEVFLTAYTLDGADPQHRPVTFAFNGGPGSSSIWLHLGLLGPRLAVSGDVGALEPPPYGLADNPESLLEHSDLVFIDPVSTGYSRAIEGKKPKDYHGFSADLSSVGEIIRLWVTRHGRWLSPKFVAGESYGTVRAAGLAEHLQSKYGMYLNGLMLLSSVLDFGTQFFSEGNDLAYALYVPTYAAVAHYHGLHGQRELTDVLNEAEEFASGDYLWALARGARLSTAQRSDIASRLAALTTLSQDFVERVNLRVEHVRFFTELLRDRRLVVGRLDSRFTGSEKDYGLERMSADPSFNAIHGPYAAALNHYVRAELGYENDLPYEILSFGVNSAWSYSEFENAHVTVADRLASAMRANPYLKVHVAFGYHDGATPYYAAEHALAHLDVPDSLLGNVSREYYHAGHMMYVHEPSRLKQSEDLKNFVVASANR